MTTTDFPGDDKTQLEKAKKNLIYIAMLSVVMFFGGLTSAYIVSMGDSFWLKAPLPTAFWISTTLIILSSITIQIAVNYVKKQNLKWVRIGLITTFILGSGFAYFQFKAYSDLVNRGIYAVGSHIIVTDGKYGDYYEVKMNGHFIEVDGNDFLVHGKKMSAQQLSDYKKFMGQFLELKQDQNFEVNNSQGFELYLENKPTYIENKRVFKSDSTELAYVDRLRLRDLALHVNDERGDFFARGKIGKDFNIYYKGKALEYKNRQLELNGVKLSNYLQIKAMESADTASSYLYIITFAHLLHILITMIYLLRLITRSFTGTILKNNAISLRIGSIFWHFLDILWIYLLLFLLFIH